MFNLSSIFTTAAQAMAKRFVASDSMYQQYKAFCSQLGMAELWTNQGNSICYDCWLC